MSELTVAGDKMGESAGVAGGRRTVWNVLYPESRFASTHRASVPFLFYSQIADLISPESVILDFGAGRGQLTDYAWGHARNLMNMRGRVKRVIGVDPDPRVALNPTLDLPIHIRPGEPLPLEDASVDLIVSCYTIEHIQDPVQMVAEIDRILKPGGWFCACTPNKWGYTGLFTRLIPNAFHHRLKRYACPYRKTAESDVFPTCYRMNTLGAIDRLFHGYQNRSYILNCAPAFHFGSLLLARFWQIVMALSPYRMGQTLFVFVQKPGGAASAPREIVT